MSKFLGGISDSGKNAWDKEGNGMLDSLMDSDLMDGLKSKMGGFFK